MTYRWDFSWVWRNFDVLLAGVGVTLLLTALTFLIGITAAPALVMARRSLFFPLRWLAAAFIEVFRDLPVLVVLVWLYFCLPMLISSSAALGPFWVAVIGLTLNFVALEAEILRAGYENIPAPQIEAARALQFPSGRIMRHIIIPQTLWRSLAPTLGQMVNTLKLSSLASFITVPELFHQTGTLIQETYRPLEFYSAMAVLYLALILPIAVVLQQLEARMSQRFRHE